MKILKVLLIIVTLALCSGCFGLETPKELKIKVIKHDPNFSKLVLFYHDKTLYGINRDSLEITLEYKFNRYIENYNSKTDDKIFVNLLGESGDYDNKVAVINKEGKIERTINTVYIPTLCVARGKYLFIDGSTVNKNGKVEIAVHDMSNDYKVVKKYEVDTKVAGIDVYDYKNRLMYDTSTIDGETKILTINKDTLESTYMSKYGLKSPSMIQSFSCWFYDEVVVTVPNRLLKPLNNEFYVYDVESEVLKKTVNIHDYIKLPEGIAALSDEKKKGALWLINPYTIGNDLIVFYSFWGTEFNYDRMLVFDKNTFEFKEEIDLDTDGVDHFVTRGPVFIDEERQHIYMKSAAHTMYLYDYKNKKWIKTYKMY